MNCIPKSPDHKLIYIFKELIIYYLALIILILPKAVPASNANPNFNITEVS